MTRGYHFVIIVGLIFLFDRLSPIMAIHFIYLFPIFTVMILLGSPKYIQDFQRLAIAGFIFDPFSGFTFGFFSLIIFTMGLTIYLARKQLSVDQNSLFPSIIFFLIFMTEFHFLLAIKLPLNYLVTVLPETLGYSIIFYLLFFFTFQKLRNPNVKKI